MGTAFALAIILLDFYLLRKRKIQGKGFAFWFTVGVVLGLFSTVPYLFELLTLLYGTEELISAVTATGFLFFLLVFLFMHSRISELQNLVMKLTMELSLIKHEQEKTDQDSTKVKSENAAKQEDTRVQRDSKRRASEERESHERVKT
ncbi:MAG: DUF2304 domain-containing protein [Candidatus Bathyarchaeota archaeon]|nr:DUF2304 domain-containing protein [Candidatus Bathyarchaeota archaeon]